MRSQCARPPAQPAATPSKAWATSAASAAPSAGRKFSWRTIEIWQTEGKYIPPPRHGWLLFVTPVLMLALYIAGPLIGAGEILAIAAGWLWASGCLFVAFNQAMSRHGGVFALALAIPCAIVLGGVVTAVSGGVLAIAASFR